MRLELAERLRCPAAHPAAPLIVVAQETRDRVLHRAIVGCAVCGLEARLSAGALAFASGLVVTGVNHSPSVPDDAAALDRLVALLHLDAPGGAVLLAGRYARFAAALQAASGVLVAVLRVPAGADLGVASAIPFTDATFRAAAVDGLAPTLLADLARTVASEGRVIGSASTRVPEAVRLLAHDAAEWVGASTGVGGAVIALRRGPSGG